MSRKADTSNAAGTSGREKGGKGHRAPVSRWTGKGPIFKFVGLFALLLGSFYALSFIPVLNKEVLPKLQVANAHASAAVMNLWGERASVTDTTISSPRYSVNIAHGCDAIEPAALFVAAVLAFPVVLRWKLLGLVVGVAVLMIINLFRIISLFYTGVHWPSAFETMHIDVWQPAFVLLALFFWVVWALWATKPPQPVAAQGQAAHGA
jgi:exosortase H (IPTLxxWG-CTERM-specific)